MQPTKTHTGATVRLQISVQLTSRSHIRSGGTQEKTDERMNQTARSKLDRRSHVRIRLDCEKASSFSSFSTGHAPAQMRRPETERSFWCHVRVASRHKTEVTGRQPMTRRQHNNLRRQRERGCKLSLYALESREELAYKVQ